MEHDLLIFMILSMSTLTQSAQSRGRDTSQHRSSELGPFLQEQQQTQIYSNDTCKPVGNEKYQSCACIINRTGGIINLHGIINNCTDAPGGCKVPRFTALGTDKWNYAYHPCFPFSLFQNETVVHPGYRSCKNVAAARYTRATTKECDNLGSQSSFEYQNHEININRSIVSTLSLTFKTNKNSAVISLVCNRSIPANESKFNFLGITNIPSPTYFMAVESSCCCPDGCKVTFPTGAQSDKPTKGFWIIVAIVLGILVVLIISIIVLQCKKKKKQDPEQRRLIDPIG